ncbi:MAG: cadherin-like domain-containing protein, partial [Sphingomonadales bacterium]|nr:cadherin-like domain-containing protein [Sphingomonadales bacterium]
LFTVSLSPSGAYTVTLLDNVLHAAGGGEASAPVVDLHYLATDSDGDTNATGMLSITFNDDAPTAINDGVTQGAENAAVTINVFANDIGGADGTLASTTALVAGSLHNGANAATGTLVNNGNGTFTYTPGPGEEGTVSFQYTITDGDGDTSQATASITLLPDSVPQPVNAVAAVDDDGLAGGNPGGVGDIDANAGEPGATPSEAIYTGAFSVNFGNDTGTVSFANLNGTTGTVGTETVSYAWNALTNTLTATGPRGALFTVSLSPSGAYTVTLLDNVLHAAGGNETSTVVDLHYLAADNDGSSSTAGQLSITFNDDTPTLGSIQNQQASNDPTQTPAVGTLHFSAGADGFGSLTIGANLAGITSGGHALVTQQVGNVLTAYADNNNSGTYDAGDSAVFTLTVNPTAGTSGQYVFDLLAPLDTTITNASIGGASSFGAGPTATQILSSGATNIAVVSGWSVGGSFDAAHWFDGTNALPGGLTLSAVNGSTGGWGVANQNFNANEFMRFDFGSPTDDFDGAGPYQAAPITLPEISYAKFNLIGFGSTETLQFRIHYTDGTSSNASVNGAQTGYTLSAPVGKFIDWIDIYGPNVGNGSGKISLTDVGVTSTTIDKTLPFNLQLTDGDGDPTATGSFSVHVQTGASPLAPAAPIAVDLNGDGVHYLATDAGVTFDYTGSGQKVATAWVDGHDGLLAIDANHSGSVDSGAEIVFGGNGLTDLQGLAATYDTNHDGVLDAKDAAFAQFGVWQDANSNGVSDPGEFKTLTELGIASINLTSNGQAGTAAGGDVSVFGTTTFTRTDGTTGTASDVAFLTSALQRQTQPAELATVSAAAAGLLAAMALDHANASADTGLPSATVHTMDLPAAAALPSLDLTETTTQPASIQLSAQMATKVAALVDGHGRADLTDAARDHASLDQLADHGVDKGAGDAQAAAKSALFAAPDAGHAVMDALLTTAAAPAEAKAAAPAQPVVAEALADATDNHAVDHIVDHFTATGAVELGASPKAGDFALQGLLDSSVQGTGHDAGAPHFNLMQALDHEQAAAMA